MKLEGLKGLAAFKQQLIDQGVKDQPVVEVKTPKQLETTIATKEIFSLPKIARDQDYLAYDFIDIQLKEPRYSYEDRGNLTGTLKIDLEAISPLVAINQFEGQQKPDDKRLAASSIKGMLRTAAEIIWDDLVSVYQKTNYNRHSDMKPEVRRQMQEIEKNLSELLISRTTQKKHRLACHLFGFVSDEKDSRTANPITYRSNLVFSDARVVGSVQSAEVYIRKNKLAAAKGVYNDAKFGKKVNELYIKEPKKVAGRKVYLAGKIIRIKDNLVAKNVPQALGAYVKADPRFMPDPKDTKVQMIYPPAKYTFEIQFNRLTEEQLAALIRVIELDGIATHALGRGKPFGLGRVRLQVKEIAVKSAESFFDLSKKSTDQLMDKAELLRTTKDEFLEKRKLFELYGTIDNFDDKKAYMPKGNKNSDGSLQVVKYSKSLK